MTDPGFRSFIRSERETLIRYVRSLLRGSATAEAEDIVQDVLLKLLERTRLIVPSETPAAYVYRSLKNRVIDFLRTRKPTLSLDGSAGEDDARLVDVLADGNPNALDALQTREGEAELFEALNSLSEIERNVVIAHELEGVPFKDLSEKWQIPQNTLLSHKSRALKKLKRHFSKL